MSEEIPRCTICNEQLELEEWLGKLNAGQPFKDWHEGALPNMTFAAIPVCSQCKNDPERTERFLDSMGTEEYRRRLKAVVRRSHGLDERFREERR